jgi:hypothetical protein
MYRAYAERMSAANTPAERKAVVDDMRRDCGLSTASAYRILAENGWESGRKKRKDAGSTSVDDALLHAVAEMTKQCVRKNGKAALPVNVARSILQSRGVDVPVRDARLRELLREQHLSIADVKTPAPHQNMRSEYPNQIHFADPSVSLIYFAPGGKQKIIGDDELYKNKNFLEGKPKCWRYALTDHYSGSICVRYYAAGGETAANMYDFLLYAWRQKKHHTYVFHGAPELLIWDCGSANIAKATVNALRAFGVKTIPHLPGNPRAKGQVENGNNLVETQFESRLRLEPVNGIEELNDAAERWRAAWNGNLIDGLDTRLKRNGVKVGVRTELWQRIPKDKLRELPDDQICRQVFASGIQTRKVAGDLSVGIVHPKIGRSLRYSLRGFDGVLVGMKVELQPVLVTAEPLCIVSYQFEGNEVSYEIKPIELDEAGFDVTAPVFGKDYKRPPDTAREKKKRELETPENLKAVMGAARSFIQPKQPFLRQTTGAQIEIAETARTHTVLITAVEFAKRLKARGVPLKEGLIGELRGKYPDGVPAQFVDLYEKEYRAKNPEKIDFRGEASVFTGGAKTESGKRGVETAPEALIKTA